MACSGLFQSILLLCMSTCDAAGPGGHMIQGVGLRLLACLDCGFESHQGHGCLSVVSVVCCQVEVATMSCSLVHSRRIVFGES